MNSEFRIPTIPHIVFTLFYSLIFFWFIPTDREIDYFSTFLVITDPAAI